MTTEEMSKKLEELKDNIENALRITNGIERINYEPTINIITQKQFEKATEDVMKELTTGTLDSLERSMFLALAFGNLELRLFGGEENDI